MFVRGLCSFSIVTYTGLILHGGNGGDCLRCPLSLPWCPWNAPVEIYNFLIGCPLPKRNCLGALALSKTKHTALHIFSRVDTQNYAHSSEVRSVSCKKSVAPPCITLNAFQVCWGHTQVFMHREQLLSNDLAPFWECDIIQWVYRDYSSCMGIIRSRVSEITVSQKCSRLLKWNLLLHL